MSWRFISCHGARSVVGARSRDARPAARNLELLHRTEPRRARTVAAACLCEPWSAIRSQPCGRRARHLPAVTHFRSRCSTAEACGIGHWLGHRSAIAQPRIAARGYLGRHGDGACRLRRDHRLPDGRLVEGNVAQGYVANQCAAASSPASGLHRAVNDMLRWQPRSRLKSPSSFSFPTNATSLRLRTDIPVPNMCENCYARIWQVTCGDTPRRGESSRKGLALANPGLLLEACYSLRFA